MKKLYISYCTEYEQGWGSKPDGFVISADRHVLISRIKPYNERENGTIVLFWSYTPPEEIWCTNEDYDRIIFKEGIAHDGLLKKLFIKLYKQL